MLKGLGFDDARFKRNVLELYLVLQTMDLPFILLQPVY